MTMIFNEKYVIPVSRAAMFTVLTLVGWLFYGVLAI